MSNETAISERLARGRPRGATYRSRRPWTWRPPWEFLLCLFFNFDRRPRKGWCGLAVGAEVAGWVLPFTGLLWFPSRFRRRVGTAQPRGAPGHCRQGAGITLAAGSGVAMRGAGEEKRCDTQGPGLCPMGPPFRPATPVFSGGPFSQRLWRVHWPTPRLQRSTAIRLRANRLPTTPLLGGRVLGPHVDSAQPVQPRSAPPRTPHLASFQLLPPGLSSPWDLGEGRSPLQSDFPQHAVSERLLSAWHRARRWSQRRKAQGHSKPETGSSPVFDAWVCVWRSCRRDSIHNWISAVEVDGGFSAGQILF